MKKVFLGGTCNNSTWREKLKPMLKIKFFDPVVDDWDEAAYQKELKEREICDYCLYTITPEMTGVYSIAELTDDSNKRPEKTVVCFLFKAGRFIFNEGQKRSLKRVGQMVERNGGKVFYSLRDIANFLNNDKGGKK